MKDFNEVIIDIDDMNNLDKAPRNFDYDRFSLFVNAGYDLGQQYTGNHISGLADFLRDYYPRNMQEMLRQFGSVERSLEDKELKEYLFQFINIMKMIDLMDNRIIEAYQRYFGIKDLNQASRKVLTRRIKEHLFKRKLPVPDTVLQLSKESMDHSVMLDDLRAKIFRRLNELQNG